MKISKQSNLRLVKVQSGARSTSTSLNVMAFLATYRAVVLPGELFQFDFNDTDRHCQLLYFLPAVAAT